MVKKFLTLVILLLIATTLHAGQRVVARVNGVELTERQLNRVMNELMPMMFYHKTISPDKLKKLRRQAMDELIKRELYYLEAKRLGMKAERSLIEEGIKKIKSRFPSEEAFRQALKREGITEDDLRSEVEWDLLVRRFIKEEIKKKAEVSDEELRDYYEKNKESFVRPEAVRIRHILIRVDPSATPEEKKEKKSLAEDILRRLKEGEDFAELAYKYSEDNWYVKGGDLGLVHRGRLLPELEKVAFQLKDGEVSGLIKTIYGYHIIKKEGSAPPTRMKFEEVRAKLKRDLEQKRRQEIEERLLNRLKSEAQIEVLSNREGG